MNQTKPKVQKIFIKYEGVGKTIESIVTFDEYNISIVAPQEAAERFQRWLKHAIIKNNDYRDMILPMFKPTKAGEPIYFPLIGEEGWTISVVK